MTPEERALAEMDRNARWHDRVFVALCVLAYLLFVAFLATGCSHRAPDLRPAPPARIEAHLTAFPPLTIAGRSVMLVAWLDDPEGAVKCPTLTWYWPNDTVSSHTSDCDPSEIVTRHQDIRRGTPGVGEFLVRVAFAAAGKEWRASTTVYVQ